MLIVYRFSQIVFLQVNVFAWSYIPRGAERTIDPPIQKGVLFERAVAGFEEVVDWIIITLTLTSLSFFKS